MHICTLRLLYTCTLSCTLALPLPLPRDDPAASAMACLGPRVTTGPVASWGWRSFAQSQNGLDQLCPFHFPLFLLSSVACLCSFCLSVLCLPFLLPAPLFLSFLFCARFHKCIKAIAGHHQSYSQTM